MPVFIEVNKGSRISKCQYKFRRGIVAVSGPSPTNIIIAVYSDRGIDNIKLKWVTFEVTRFIVSAVVEIGDSLGA